MRPTEPAMASDTRLPQDVYKLYEDEMEGQQQSTALAALSRI